MSTIGAPDLRTAFSAVWSGTEMIVWGREQWGIQQFNTAGATTL
jgi:hypothetical protein